MSRVTVTAPSSLWVSFIPLLSVTRNLSLFQSHGCHYIVLVFQFSKLAFKLKSKATSVGFWVVSHPGMALSASVYSVKLITPVPQGTVTSIERAYLELD